MITKSIAFVANTINDAFSLALSKDGTNAMSGDLNLVNNKITNVANPINALDVVIKQYAETVTNDFFSTSGDSMDGILDMGNNFVQNVRTPCHDGDASNKKYTDDTLAKSHLISSHKTNTFKHLIAQDDPEQF